MPASLFTSLAAAILRARRPLLVVIILLTALAAWQLPRLKLDTSNEIWFVEGHPALEALHKFERLFRNDDFVYVVGNERLQSIPLTQPWRFFTARTNKLAA